MITERREEPDRKRSPFLRIDSWMLPIAVISLAITMVGVLLALATTQGPEAEVTLETISETDILDLRRSLQDLSIVFRGQNVEEQNLNLRILTIKVANTGTIDILPVHYDVDDDWGIKFDAGEVIEARLVDTNSDYLRSKIVPQLLGTDVVAFPKVIFEEGDSFALEVLLLHLKHESPLVSTIGKIAGIKEFIVSTGPLDRQEASLFARLFPGSAYIQAIRTIIYFIGSVIATLAAIVVTYLVTESVKKLRAWRRRRRILRSWTIRQIHQPKLRDFLVTFYTLASNSAHRQLQDLIREPQKAAAEVPLDEWIGDGNQQQHDWISSMPFLDMHFRDDITLLLLRVLATKGFVKKGEDGNICVEQSLVEAIRNLSTELNI